MKKCSRLAANTTVEITDSGEMKGGHVPILILLIDLSREMTRQKWEKDEDLVVNYLKLVHGEGSRRCKMLLHMLETDRALLILDGLDEAGKNKDAIETYIQQRIVTSRRCHLVVSSRNTGFNEKEFGNFSFLQLAPLTPKMQKEVVKKRAPKAHLENILDVIDKPEYSEMARNPLMLSLLISVFGKLKADKWGTRSELYDEAVGLMVRATAVTTTTWRTATTITTICRNPRSHGHAHAVD